MTLDKFVPCQSTAIDDGERVASLSVVIPAFNEERGIARVIERVLALRAVLARAGLPGLEVIVVDDGSHDRTVEIVRRFPEVLLTRHPENRGYGAALKTGLSRANGDLVAFLDADETYPPESFPRLCRAALDGADVVIGSRMSGADSKMPWVRRQGNRGFAGLITLLSGQHVSDSASGMRVIRRAVLPRLYPLPNGLNFTPIMSLRAIHEGLNVVEVPIPYGERVGASKLGVVRDGLRYARSILWTALGYNPIRVLGAAGVGGIGIAALVGAGLAAARLQGITTLGPWGVTAIFLALIAAVAGVSLFGLGITFNCLVALFRKRPSASGVFGRSLLDRPIHDHFGWLGMAVGGMGLALASTALALGVNGWDITRLWLYLTGSALLMLVGLQLFVSWVVIKTLDELCDREFLAGRDLARGDWASSGVA